jgi:hypothetical protein
MSENNSKRSIQSGMESLNQLYRIGCGPSSSHTMGPEKACVIFKEKNAAADEFKVVLYGSLAKTGKGHCTDSVIENTLAPTPTTVEFDFDKRFFNNIKFCDNCSKLLYFKLGQKLIPKSPKNMFNELKR